ncbi:erythritol transport system ATP-binding protein [Mameliella alba]|uniref:sugar ABC transporter ATP-binding protein n=1 Tax=Mameliella alba TaxID=561184 RepID=UPI00088E9670|nr:sugar ABC transporter ATP-binding protein [Mameliella alba]OWV50481.1 sugar ABC transporter ATP-binding protein [Mameliella alba]PTR42094.1 erythritol transport system ATP-binding protein [Mameliella alba]GGF54971.1 sugar ABC transporter ATP-binding protein [Mameliella alba]SDB98584.1 erythritol transport system ATP-binding protein [Mameliella alba]
MTLDPDPGSAHPIGLSIRGGTKVYPGTIALKEVDFDLRMGAVNVLVGENGAGKSTMMKVIAGVEQLTSGTVTMNGEEVNFTSTDDAERNGIGIVFQELNLFPNLTVADNIFMAHEKTRGGIDIDMSAQREATRALMQRLEHDIDPDTLVGDLKVGQQQIVEIAKSLSRDARILILDEPTSALSNAEVEILFRVIEELKAEGVGIVYISHRLEELIRVGDYITVLRDGTITGAQSMEGVDIPWIVRNMIGDSSKDFAKEIEHPFGDEALRVENMRLADTSGGFAVDGVSLSLRAGEILGIYGLMGAGRTELLETIIGRHSHAVGDVWVQGDKMGRPSVPDRIAKGLALIPEDRKHDGLVQILSIRENMTLSSVGSFTRGVHMDLGKERSRVADFVRRMVIKIASPEHPVSALSGGNQQKVVISKALMTGPKVLLMDEPSRGIDIGAKAEVFRVMRQLAAEGLGIVFVTSDLEEVMSLSDRIIVMSDGRITGEFSREEVTETALVSASAVGHAPLSEQDAERETAQ